MEGKRFPNYTELQAWVSTLWRGVEAAEASSGPDSVLHHAPHALRNPLLWSHGSPPTNGKQGIPAS